MLTTLTLDDLDDVALLALVLSRQDLHPVAPEPHPVLGLDGLDVERVGVSGETVDLGVVLLAPGSVLYVHLDVGQFEGLLEGRVPDGWFVAQALRLAHDVALWEVGVGLGPGQDAGVEAVRRAADESDGEQSHLARVSVTREGTYKRSTLRISFTHSLHSFDFYFLSALES